MAQEIGIAYVTVAPSAKGFGKAVEGEIDKGVSGASKSAGGRLKSLATGVVKWGTAAVVGVGAAITGLALKGGISRALNIEDAQAKLQGLGHDTKTVEAIMNDALASVRGTAFGLDTAATVAATAVAAGIKPGQELEKYLRLTADAATIAGVSMEEMGSILNKATTAGKVYTQELNQLADRGLPIFQWLQDEYGVTAEELRKMVAAGKVDAETFRKVIEDNIGGAALASGDTTRGAFANMQAAMSRFGVALLGDGLGSAKTFFSEITVIFDGLTERVGPWIKKIQDKLGEMFQFEGMGDNFLDWLDGVATAIQNGPIPQILTALQPILPVLVDLAGLLGGVLGDAVGEFARALAPELPVLAEALSDAVTELAPAFGDLATELAELAKVGIPVLKELLPLVGPAVTAHVSGFADSVSGLATAIGFLGDTWDGFGDESKGEGPVYGRTVSELGELGDQILRVMPFLGPLMRGLQELGIDSGVVATQIHDVLKNIGTFFNDLGASISTFFNDVGTSWVTFWDSLPLIVAIAGANVWATVTGWMDAVLLSVVVALGQVGAWWSDTWANISTTVANGVAAVVTFMASLPNRIKSALSALPGILAVIGVQMIQGLINGVSSMIQSAVNAVKNVGGAMLEAIQSFLGIKSPSRLFRDEVGKMIGLGLLEGINDSAIRGRIDTAVNHLVNVPEGISSGREVGFNQTVTVARDMDPTIFGRKTGRAIIAELVGVS